jgi:hypothetical protein
VVGGQRRCDECVELRILERAPPLREVADGLRRTARETVEFDDRRRRHMLWPDATTGEDQRTQRHDEHEFGLHERTSVRAEPPADFGQRTTTAR